jgi:hypothetical protein
MVTVKANAPKLTLNVRAEPTVQAGAAWPWKDDDHDCPERPGEACRSGSARLRG